MSLLLALIVATHVAQDTLACNVGKGTLGGTVYHTWFSTFMVSTRKKRVDPALANSRYTSLCLSSSIEASADFSSDIFRGKEIIFSCKSSI